MSAKLYFVWKQKLINTNYKRVQLHQCKTIHDDIEKDIHRTFPENSWFTEERKTTIKNILMHFVIMNKGLSYCQGMCFIIFTLYYVFHRSDYADIETLYCFHKLVEPIRPIYPLSENDRKPITYVENLSKVILLKLHKYDIVLAERLSQMDIVPYFIINGLPAMFANWYKMNDVIRLWNNIIDASVERMYDNIVMFLVQYFLSIKDLCKKMDLHEILLLLSEKRELKIYK